MQMAVVRQFTPTSLVLKAGIAVWIRADTVEELKGLFVNVMPSIPPVEG